MKKLVSFLLLLILATNTFAGLSIVRSNGISLTGADGIQYVGVSGITLTGADGLLLSQTNGISLTGADAQAPAATNGTTYTGPNGITLTGADGMNIVNADGITLTGADGITLTGADGTQYKADSITISRPNGISMTGPSGITLTGADGITLTGADTITQVGPDAFQTAKANGITLTGADGITSTGANGITLTGADSLTGYGPAGVLFQQYNPGGITLTGADGITLTGADGITITNPVGITLTGADASGVTGSDGTLGLQSVDPELAVQLNSATDDSSVNAIIVFHNAVSDADIAQLQQIGILGGTRLRVLPMVYVTATRAQLIAVSHLTSVRSIYGNRTLNFNSDPYFNVTGVQRVPSDQDLLAKNGSIPVTGRNVTVAVLDTGINAQHTDLVGKVVQNVRLADTQSLPTGFVYPVPTENLANTDLVDGHGTFVSGVIAASGASSNGKYSGVAPGAKLLGLSAGDVNLMYVLSGFDYLLDKGAAYNVRVVNCSFSAKTVFDINDPVNIATKMLTDRGVSVVVSAGNDGSGNGTLNPYSVAPWVIGVGATDYRGTLADFSSRGYFGDSIQHPSLVAPGVNIVSLRNLATVTSVSGLGGADTQRLSTTELPYYTTASGTSFSAPQVAGAIALMLEANPYLRPGDIKNILSKTATPLPKYFYHETGAGMLNTYAAVLEAAFPDRRMGTFRSTLSMNTIKFVTSTTQTYTQMVYPAQPASTSLAVPQNAVQANIKIVWGLSSNNFGLNVYDSNGKMLGQSNNLILPGLTGRKEEVVLRNPASQTIRADAYFSANVGTPQNVYGAAEITQVVYPNLVDFSALSTQSLLQAQNSLLTSVMLPRGRKYRPDSAVTRSDFADAIVRSGLVSQYMAASPLFTDVLSVYMRDGVESVQSNPDGKLIYDASIGSHFYPNNTTSKLVAAVAYVKAAKLDSVAATASLPLTVTDATSIPANLQGYVAVALQKGFVTLDGNQFNPSRPITRIELASALNLLINS